MRTWKLKAALVLACTIILPAPAAATVLYVATSTHQLLNVEPTSGEVELVGTTSAQFTDIAFDQQGRLFGVTSSYLYEIDPRTAQCTLIGDHGYGWPGLAKGIDSLVFGPDGVLYAAGDNVLITLNPQTAVARRVGGLSGYRSAGDLAFNAAGRLLLTTDAGVLVEVDPVWAGAQPVGDLPYGDIFAMAADEAGTLYGVRANNDVVTISSDAGEATVLSSLRAGFLLGSAWGAAIIQAPEPSTVLSSILITLLIGRRRKSRHARR